MSDITVISSTQKIVVDPFSSSVAIFNAGPVGPQGQRGPTGYPGSETGYVTDAEVSVEMSTIDSRLDALEAKVSGAKVVLTPVNGFVRYGLTWPEPAVRKKNDMVFMEGLIRHGTTQTPAGGTVMCVLPVGYRPPGAHVFLAISASATCRFDIWADGNVIYRSGNADYISFFGLQFGSA